MSAFDCTARQSFVIQMVERHEDLPNAIAINSSVFNAARLLGPAVAGLAIGTLGECPCFFLNGLSYLAVIAALLAMRVGTPPPCFRVEDRRGPERRTGLRGRLDAHSHAVDPAGNRRHDGRAAHGAHAAAGYRGAHGGPHTLGMLTSALGIGALAASLFLAARKSVLGLGRVIAVATAAFGLGLAGISFSHTLGLSLLLMVLTGFAMVTQMAGTNALLQTIVEENKRGRVMSFYTLAFFGMGPLGSLLSGCLAGTLGTLAAFFICGTVCVAGSMVFAALLPAMRRTIRPIYMRVGVLPASTVEVQPRRQAAPHYGRVSNTKSEIPNPKQIPSIKS